MSTGNNVRNNSITWEYDLVVVTMNEAVLPFEFEDSIIEATKAPLGSFAILYVLGSSFGGVVTKQNIREQSGLLLPTRDLGGENLKQYYRNSRYTRFWNATTAVNSSGLHLMITSPSVPELQFTGINVLANAYKVASLDNSGGESVSPNNGVYHTLVQSDWATDDQVPDEFLNFINNNRFKVFRGIQLNIMSTYDTLLSDITGGGGAGTAMNDLTDVTFAKVVGNDGQVLSYDHNAGATEQFTNTPEIKIIPANRTIELVTIGAMNASASGGEVQITAVNNFARMTGTGIAIESNGLTESTSILSSNEVTIQSVGNANLTSTNGNVTITKAVDPVFVAETFKGVEDTRLLALNNIEITAGRGGDGTAEVRSLTANANITAQVDANVEAITGNAVVLSGTGSARLTGQTLAQVNSPAGNVVVVGNQSIIATAQNGNVNISSLTDNIQNTIPTGTGFVDINSGAEGASGYATRIDTRDEAVTNVAYVKSKAPTADPVLDIQNFSPEFQSTLGLQGTSICTASNLQVDQDFNQVEGAGGRWYEGFYMFEGLDTITSNPLPQGSDPYRNTGYVPQYTDFVIRCKYGGDKFLYAKMNNTSITTSYTPSNPVGAGLVREPVVRPFGASTLTIQLYGSVTIGTGVAGTTFSEPLSNFLFTQELLDLDLNETMRIPLSQALSWQKFGAESGGIVTRPDGNDLLIEGAGITNNNVFVRVTTGNDNRVQLNWTGTAYFAYLSFISTSIYTQNFLVKTKIENAVSPPDQIQYNVSASNNVVFRRSTDPVVPPATDPPPITSWTQQQVDNQTIYGTITSGAEDFSVTFSLTDLRLNIVGTPITRTFAVKGGYCRPPAETSEAIFEATSAAVSTKASKDPIGDPDTGSIFLGSTNAPAGLISGASWANGQSFFIRGTDTGDVVIKSYLNQGIELEPDPPNSTGAISFKVGSGAGSIVKINTSNKTSADYANEINVVGTGQDNAIPNVKYVKDKIAERPHICIFKSQPYATSISVATPLAIQTYYPVSDASLNNVNNSLDFTNLNGLITYTGTDVKRFRVSCTAGLYGDVQDEKIFFKINKNGINLVEDFKTGLSYSKNTITFAENIATISYIDQLGTGDTLQLVVGRDNGSTITQVFVNQCTIVIDQV